MSLLSDNQLQPTPESYSGGEFLEADNLGIEALSAHVERLANTGEAPLVPTTHPSIRTLVAQEMVDSETASESEAQQIQVILLAGQHVVSLRTAAITAATQPTQQFERAIREDDYGLAS